MPGSVGTLSDVIAMPAGYPVLAVQGLWPSDPSSSFFRLLGANDEDPSWFVFPGAQLEASRDTAGFAAAGTPTYSFTRTWSVPHKFAKLFVYVGLTLQTKVIAHALPASTYVSL
jgi:hypothetical protein